MGDGEGGGQKRGNGGGRGRRGGGRGGGSFRGNKRRKQFHKKDKKNPKPDVWQKDIPGKVLVTDQLQGAPIGGGGNRPNGGSWEPWKLSNEEFEAYYKAQNILGEEEWEPFLKVLRTQLPATFRINKTGKFAIAIRDKLKSELFADMMKGALEATSSDREKPAQKVNIEAAAGVPTAAKTEEGDKGKAAAAAAETETLDPLKPLAWYPDEFGWQMQYSRNQIRKLPVLAQFHEFLKRENDAGNITRQETASMIPPFFLDVKPESKILDMCAAPGSKTFQLLEMIHSAVGSEAGQSGDQVVVPTGYVVANDADAKRCNLLTHQTKRMCSPCLLVTNHEGQRFPIIRDRTGTNEDGGDEQARMFDRILCDVPCSGDGTLRKAPDLWRRWNTGMGNGLHRLQLKIAMRACELLEVGGRLVYSTCSFNPIENEAVVAEILRRTGDAFELLDVSKEMPLLKTRPGLKTWKVRDQGGWAESLEAVQDRSHKFCQSMFPDAASDAMPLERSNRILPHDDNTGGFFVAVFKKLKPYTQSKPKPQPKKEEETKPETEPVKTEEEGVKKEETVVKKEETTTETKEEAVVKKEEPQPVTKRVWKGLDPIVDIRDKDIQTSLNDFYGLKADALDIEKNFVTRTPEGAKPKRIYYISESIRKILDEDARGQLRISSVGVKIFEKQASSNVKVAYRITQDGLPAILPLMTKQIFRPSLKEFVLLLKERTLVIPEAPPGVEGPKTEEGGETKSYIQQEHMMKRARVVDDGSLTQLRDVWMGCCVAMMRQKDAEDLGFIFNGKPLTISCWRGKITVNLLTSKNETDQVLEKFPEDLKAIKVEELEQTTTAEA